MAPQVYANSSRARCAIYSCDTAIRICSVPRLTCKNRFVKISSWDKVMSLAEYFCHLYLFGFSKYGHILGITLWWRPQGSAWQASPWKHRPSSSAPCAVLMGPSRVGQHIKDEPCAKQRTLLGVSYSRYSSVSRGVRSVVSIFS